MKKIIELTKATEYEPVLEIPKIFYDSKILFSDEEVREQFNIYVNPDRLTRCYRNTLSRVVLAAYYARFIGEIVEEPMLLTFDNNIAMGRMVTEKGKTHPWQMSFFRTGNQRKLISLFQWIQSCYVAVSVGQHSMICKAKDGKYDVMDAVSTNIASIKFDAEVLVNHYVNYYHLS